MASFVEDAGEPFRAEWASFRFKRIWHIGSVVRVGARDVRWALDGAGGATVTHAPAGTGSPITYRVAPSFTTLPSGGSRQWWTCPACGNRVGLLYLPAYRDRLACRTCCGLVYGSRYGRPKIRRKKRAPAVVTREAMIWTAATGWVPQSRNRTRSRPRALNADGFAPLVPDANVAR